MSSLSNEQIAGTVSAIIVALIMIIYLAKKLLENQPLPSIHFNSKCCNDGCEVCSFKSNVSQTDGPRYLNRSQRHRLERYVSTSNELVLQRFFNTYKPISNNIPLDILMERYKTFKNIFGDQFNERLFWEEQKLAIFQYENYEEIKEQINSILLIPDNYSHLTSYPCVLERINGILQENRAVSSLSTRETIELLALENDAQERRKSEKDPNPSSIV